MEGLLTSLLKSFVNSFDAGTAVVVTMGTGLLGFLLIIDLIISHGLNLKDEDHISLLIRECLKYGTYLFFLKNYIWLKGEIIEGFIYVGTQAGSAGGGGSSDIFNPSYICEIGFHLMDKVYAFVDAQTAGDGSSLINLIWAATTGELTVAKLFPNLFYWSVSLLICLAFYIIAFQVFLALLECHLVMMLIPIYLPFGVFSKTAFMAEGAIGSVIGIGSKIMLLAAIMSVSIPLIEGWSIPGSPPTQLDCLRLLSGAGGVALLSWVGPNFLGSMMNGRPSLSASTATGTAMGAAYLGHRGYGAVRGMASKGMSGAKISGQTIRNMIKPK
ncbi:type IV secretion system protein [Sporomusa sphaeroides]|uniref:TrbL/VirB6 plasmid conjugal transfer protein n=1 Tax=Sporomusa sphaeroides DSM 2875 TaxID=1337886 RepID=A0A1U7M9S5_9FIRM|nr:type IV secretion system protein [Sporomusa sphaeroides]OLS54299.1 TrbL/VirB6 plasmid conjugal transfer protein [Sporomusa sphaeroides DSM 2875]CVK21529.1 TrbL/VirB6 plasmid conjugal transfer protein [Sporomusa sphaeroides DSM 2875]